LGILSCSMHRLLPNKFSHSCGLVRMVSLKILAVVTLLGLSAAQNTYDYVIVGGGITGLVVANRLSEDEKSQSNNSSNITVKLT